MAFAERETLEFGVRGGWGGGNADFFLDGCGCAGTVKHMKKRLLIPVLFVVGSLLCLGADRPPHPFSSRIERLDPALDALLAPDVKVEKLAEGFRWSEGPCWYTEKDRNGNVTFNGIVFSDVLANTSYRWQEGWNHAEVFLRPSGLTTNQPGFRERGSNGMTRDSAGRLIICQHGERRVVRFEEGAWTVLADKFEGKRLNSPNDVCVKKNGDVYFTDPPYGLEGTVDSKLKELDFSGVYRISTDGKVTLLTKEFTYPNGICFSPDEKTLYIANTDDALPLIAAYDVKEDGTLANKRIFFDEKPYVDRRFPGLPDGMKCDKDGNIWTGAFGGVAIISPAGKLIGRIYTGEQTSNCNWGDDGSTLYVTADYFLLRIKTKTKGAGW
jgi:gluconolactonase